VVGSDTTTLLARTVAGRTLGLDARSLKAPTYAMVFYLPTAGMAQPPGASGTRDSPFRARACTPARNKADSTLDRVLGYYAPRVGRHSRRCHARKRTRASCEATIRLVSMEGSWIINTPPHKLV
jgi:hypothetical protein